MNNPVKLQLCPCPETNDWPLQRDPSMLQNDDVNSRGDFVMMTFTAEDEKYGWRLRPRKYLLKTVIFHSFNGFLTS